MHRAHDGDPRQPDPAAIEAALDVVPGVARSKVVTTVSGDPDVLRLVLSPGADEAEVTRAAERLLRLQFGVGLDAGRLEVVLDPDELDPARLRLVEPDAAEEDEPAADEDLAALLEHLDPGPGPRFDTAVLESAARHPAGMEVPVVRDDSSQGEAGGRVVVGGWTHVPAGLREHVTVTLLHGGAEHVGHAEASPSPASVNRAVATATLVALDGLRPDDVRLEVDAVSVTTLGDSSAAVVRIIWVTAEGAEHLTGSAEVRDDTRLAVIRATLDAVNRRLTLDLAD